MRYIKRHYTILLIFLLLLSTISVSAKASEDDENSEREYVIFRIIIDNYFQENVPPIENNENIPIENNEAIIAGTTEPQAPVTITVNSRKRTFETKADKNGNFLVKLENLENGKHDLKIIAGDANRNESADGPFSGGWKGFAERGVEDDLKAGAYHYYNIPLNFDPFVLRLAEKSGSLTQQWLRNGEKLIGEKPGKILDNRFENFSQTLNKKSPAQALAEEVGGKIQLERIREDAWIVSWKSDQDETYGTESDRDSALADKRTNENVSNISTGSVTDKEYLIEWTETWENQHSEWYTSKPPQDLIDQYDMELVDNRPHIEYKIEYEETTTHHEWSNDDEHKGTCIDTDEDYKIEWTEKKSDWFENPDDHEGEVVENRKDGQTGTVYVYESNGGRTVKLGSDHGTEWTDPGGTTYYFQYEKPVYNWEYKIEWKETKSQWFDDESDQDGTVIETDTDYYFEWETSEEKTDWFPSKNYKDGEVLDSRENGLEYLYEWTTEESKTHEEWFDDTSHQGEVIDSKVVGTDYTLSWTVSLSRAFNQNKESDADELVSNLQDHSNAYDISKNLGEAWIGENYGVSWSVLASVKRKYIENYRAVYEPIPGSEKTTDVSVVAKNNYEGRVDVSAEEPPGVEAKLNKNKLELQSSENLVLTMTADGGDSIFPVTVEGTIPSKEEHEEVKYRLNLQENKPSLTFTENAIRWENLSCRGTLKVIALKPDQNNGKKIWKRTNAKITVNGDVWTYSGIEERSVIPGSHKISFGDKGGYRTPSARRINISSGDHKTAVGYYREIEIEYRTLRIRIEPEDGGSTAPDSGETPYRKGRTVEVMATADEGWSFDGWTGDYESESNSIDVEMDKDREVTANFDPNLKVEKEGPGTVTLSDPQGKTIQSAQGTTRAIDYKSTVEISAEPKENAYFVRWEGKTRGIDPENPKISVKMKRPRTLRAVFSENENVGGNEDPEYYAFIMVNKSVISSHADCRTNENRIIQNGYVKFAPFKGFYLVDTNGDGKKDDIAYIDGLANLRASGEITRSSLFNLAPRNGNNDSWGLNLEGESTSRKRDFLNAPPSISDSEVESIWSTMCKKAREAVDIHGNERAFFSDNFVDFPTRPEPDRGDLSCGEKTTAAIFKSINPFDDSISAGIGPRTLWAWLWKEANDALKEEEEH